MKITLSLTDLLKKEKDSGSNQQMSELEKKDHPEYLVEPPKSILCPEEHLFLTEASAHVHLVKGVVCHNNPITVLCPILAKGIICSRGTGPSMRGTPYRPKLLMKNHANPSLQLWGCEGCKDILIRVRL